MRRKKLKGVAHSFGHSFMSMMNWYEGNYIEDILTSLMLLKKISHLEVDILNLQVTPSWILEVEPLKNSITDYCEKFFKNLVTSHELDYAKNIRKATMFIEFNFLDIDTSDDFQQNINYKCSVTIVDDNQKGHTKSFSSTTVLTDKAMIEIQKRYLLE